MKVEQMDDTIRRIQSKCSNKSQTKDEKMMSNTNKKANTIKQSFEYDKYLCIEKKKFHWD